MSPWTAAAVVLLVALVPLGYVLVRAPLADALVALELAGTVVVLVLVLLAQAFSRPSYYVVPMTLAPLSLLGGVMFARFLPTRR
jgi:multisubunit Na+/H+ antiporter MnhF subunit